MSQLECQVILFSKNSFSCIVLVLTNWLEYPYLSGFSFFRVLHITNSTF